MMKPKKKISVHEDSDKDSVSEVDFDLLSFSNISNITDLNEEFNVRKLHRISQTVKLPGTMWGVHHTSGNKTAFIHINEKMVIDKTVEFDKSCIPDVKVNGTSIELPEVRSKMHLEALLRGVDAIKKLPPTRMSLRKRKLSVDIEKTSPKLSTPLVNNVKKEKPLKRKLSKSEDVKSLSPSESENEEKPPSVRMTRSQIKSNTPKYTPIRRGRSSKIQAIQHSDEETTQKNNKKLETPKIEKKTPTVQEKPKIEAKVVSSSEEEVQETPKIVKNIRKPQWNKDEGLASFGVRCLVHCCTNSMLLTRRAGLNVSYYRFPMDETLADKWKVKCKVSGRIPNSARVCSDHFRKEDFEGCEAPGSQLIKRELKRKAIPSLYMDNKKEPVVIPQKKTRRRKSDKSDSEIKIIETKTLQNTSDAEEEEEEDEDEDEDEEDVVDHHDDDDDYEHEDKSIASRPPTPVSVASIDLTQHESDDEPIVIDRIIPTVELSDDSSESDDYEEVIQVRITHMSAESSEESETDELMVVKNRRKILKKKKPTVEHFSKYEVETFEFELKSDDSDAEVRQMKKTLDTHLINASKPQIQKPSYNGLNQTPKINTVQNQCKTWPKINSDSIEFEAEVESEKIVQSPPRQSQSLAKLLKGKNRPDKETIIKIIEQKISENYDILNNRKVMAPRMETKSSTIFINKNGKGNSLPKGIINVRQIDKKNVPSLLSKPVPKLHILDAPRPIQPKPQPLINVEKQVKIVEKQVKIAEKPVSLEKPNSTQFENMVAQLDLQVEDIEQKTDETAETLDNQNESFEFVNSNNIIIENTNENKIDDTPETMDDDQIIIVCKNEEETNEIEERIQINHHDKETHQTISIQRKSGNEVIPNKLKIPATEHTEGLKTEKGILNTLFWNNVSSENIFYTNEDLAKPEVQELLRNIPQNEIDYSKVIVLNNLEDQNVQWSELPDSVKEQVQGNELYYITQEEGSVQEVRNQSDSFDENQFLNMECLEVEVIPPEPSGNY